jgi:hypothetical protein
MVYEENNEGVILLTPQIMQIGNAIGKCPIKARATTNQLLREMVMEVSARELQTKEKR